MLFLQMAGGVSSCLLKDGMTRAPVVRMPSAIEASQVKAFIEEDDGFQLLKSEFDSTSRYKLICFIVPACTCSHTRIHITLL